MYNKHYSTLPRGQFFLLAVPHCVQKKSQHLEVLPQWFVQRSRISRTQRFSFSCLSLQICHEDASMSSDSLLQVVRYFEPSIFIQPNIFVFARFDLPQAAGVANAFDHLFFRWSLQDISLPDFMSDLSTKGTCFRLTLEHFRFGRWS